MRGAYNPRKKRSQKSQRKISDDLYNTLSALATLYQQKDQTTEVATKTRAKAVKSLRTILDHLMDAGKPPFIQDQGYSPDGGPTFELISDEEKNQE